jgi:alkylated DNA repair dioxygenase AlkB
VSGAAQRGLFESASQGPAGLAYVEAFLDAAEEARLIAQIAALDLAEASYRRFKARRRAAAFGWSHDFDRNRLVPAAPLPAFLLPLRRRVAAWLDEPPEALAHVLVNEYRPGVQLGWHRDAPGFGRVAGVSLGAACRMRWRPWPVHGDRRVRTGAATRMRDPSFTLEVAPRSAYRMDGDARWRWQHAVPPVPAQRWSVTFRTLAAPR